MTEEPGPLHSIPVLFTHYGEQWLRGSERLLLDLMTHLDPARVRPVLWCNATEMADAARQAGIETHQSDFEYYFDYRSPRFSYRRYRSFVREGMRLVRTHDIRLLHANSAAPNQFLVPVARFAGLPLLAHLHINYLRRSRYACLLHMATRIVGVSRDVAADFLRDGMAPDRIRVIYNGIDFARFDVPRNADIRLELGIPADATIILAVGSLIRRKGQDILLQALYRLGASCRAHLLIASDGPERAHLERLTTELGLQAQVHFLGYYRNLPDLYRACDIVVLASRADAFGLVLAEAGYFSRPVVSTAVGGIPEVIADGSTGLLVPPDDPGALAGALSRLLADPEYRRALGGAARQRVERLFSVERMAACFQDTYEELARLPHKRLGWSGLGVAANPYLSVLRLGHASTRPVERYR